MTWQEYQEAVGRLYEQMDELGTVRKNITIPDRITNRARQVDVWWEIEIGNDHYFKILIDAKKRSSKIDIKDVEEILALAKAVRADKAIIVTNNEWTNEAEVFANHESLDLRLLTIEQALDLIEVDSWMMCPICNKDCIIMDQDGFIEIGKLINWWLAGTCRECRAVHIHCQDCGEKGNAPKGSQWTCGCNMHWMNEGEELYLDYSNRDW